MGNIVEIADLRREFRRTVALHKVSLSVPRGGVLGLVGENGAGKTTLIRHILGLLRAQQGSVRVFNMDPIRHPEHVLSQIGYLSENRDLPGWMRVDELMRYTKAFYPKWDPAYANKLREVFQLDPTAKLRTLSQGQTAKAGLLCALAHRPDFLVLDEPSGGLDPIVRRDILAAIFRTVAEEGRTVLFSSHLLEEVELASDRVVMLHSGRVVLDSPLDAVRKGHHRVMLRATDGRTGPPSFPGLLSCEREELLWRVICYGAPNSIQAALAENGFEVVSSGTPTLEEIFVARSAIHTKQETQ
jgi:ABC-type multidrug transport system ATPase subunit